MSFKFPKGLRLKQRTLLTVVLSVCKLGLHWCNSPPQKHVPVPGTCPCHVHLSCCGCRNWMMWEPRSHVHQTEGKRNETLLEIRAMKLHRAPVRVTQPCNDGARGPVQKLIFASILATHAVKDYAATHPSLLVSFPVATSSKCGELHHFGPRTFKVRSFRPKICIFEDLVKRHLHCKYMRCFPG